MTLNELMLKHSFLVKLLLKDNTHELSKELKVKIMSMRIESSKVRTQFEKDVQEFLTQVRPEGYEDLTRKEDKTEEENKQINEMNAKINKEYDIYVTMKGKDEVTAIDSITKSEYDELVEVNAGNDVEVNGVKLSAPDFLEVIYSLFVE